MREVTSVMAKRNGSRRPIAAITMILLLACWDTAAAGSLTNTAVANGRPARGGFTAPSAQVSVPVAPCRESVAASYGAGAGAPRSVRRRMPPALRVSGDGLPPRRCATARGEAATVTGM